MDKDLSISTLDIIHNLKLSCQIPDILQTIASQKIITEAAKNCGLKLQKQNYRKKETNSV